MSAIQTMHKLKLWELKPQQAEWVSVSKEDFQCWQMDDGERWNGVEGLESTHTCTQWPYFERECVCTSRCVCADTLLSVSLFFFFYKHRSMSPYPVIYCTLTQSKMVSLSRALKCNLTHDEKHTTRIRFSCYFSFVCYPGFNTRKRREGEKEKKRGRRR